nr:uncharacterized protein LOC113813207 [Penaeus vannamei]
MRGGNTGWSWGRPEEPLPQMRMVQSPLETCTCVNRLVPIVHLILACRSSRAQTRASPALLGGGLLAQGIGFGETVFATDSASSKLAVCAPRYPRRASIYVALQPRGACFVLHNARGQYVKVLPYPDECYYLHGKCFKNTNVYTGYALHGFSVAMSEVTHRHTHAHTRTHRQMHSYMHTHTTTGFRLEE